MCLRRIYPTEKEDIHGHGALATNGSAARHVSMVLESVRHSEMSVILTYLACSVRHRCLCE
jgi:hypothetical protein